MAEAYEEQAKEQSLNVLRAAQLHDCSELVVDAGGGAGPAGEDAATIAKLFREVILRADSDVARTLQVVVFVVPEGPEAVYVGPRC